MRSMLAVTLLLAACGRTEPHAQPMQPATLCQAVMGTPQVKELAVWPSGTCLDITYDAGAAEHAQSLYAALLEWASAPGTWLCFNPPMEGAPAARGVHVRGGGAPQLALVTLDYRGRELLRSEVVFSDDFTLTHGVYLHEAGKLLGFQRTSDVESVLNAWTPDDVLPMLSEADLQSVAAVYPACR